MSDMKNELPKPKIKMINKKKLIALAKKINSETGYSTIGKCVLHQCKNCGAVIKAEQCG